MKRWMRNGLLAGVGTLAALILSNLYDDGVYVPQTDQEIHVVPRPESATTWSVRREPETVYKEPAPVQPPETGPEPPKYRSLKDAIFGIYGRELFDFIDWNTENGFEKHIGFQIDEGRKVRAGDIQKYLMENDDFRDYVRSNFPSLLEIESYDSDMKIGDIAGRDIPGDQMLESLKETSLGIWEKHGEGQILAEILYNSGPLAGSNKFEPLSFFREFAPGYIQSMGGPKPPPDYKELVTSYFTGKRDNETEGRIAEYLSSLTSISRRNFRIFEEWIKISPLDAITFLYRAHKDKDFIPFPFKEIK